MIDLYEKDIARLEAWVKEDGGFYDITRFIGENSSWEITLFPEIQTPKMKLSWVKGTAKTLKTAVDRAFKELEKVSG